MFAVVIAILVVCCFYLLSLMGRTGHKGLASLRGWSYAHRGLHGCGTPENSLEAFRRAKEAGYGAELDIHLLADGSLAVIHDSNTKRTTGIDASVEDLTAQRIKDFRLEETDERIPLFEEVLEVFGGCAPLIVELKSNRDNYAQLCQRVCEVLDSYSGAFCIESFDPRCVRWLRKNRPDIVRGQLTENYFCSASKLHWALKFALTNQLCNFLTYPDFVAYKFRDRKNLGNFLCRKLWGVQGVSWTLRNPDEYAEAVREGWIPIFENFLP